MRVSLIFCDNHVSASEGDCRPHLRSFVYAFLKIVQHVVARAHGERHNRHRRRFVRGTWENTGIANIKIRNIVRLRPYVRH